MYSLTDLMMMFLFFWFNVVSTYYFVEHVKKSKEEVKAPSSDVTEKRLDDVYEMLINVVRSVVKLQGEMQTLKHVEKEVSSLREHIDNINTFLDVTEAFTHTESTHEEVPDVRDSANQQVPDNVISTLSEQIEDYASPPDVTLFDYPESEIYSPTMFDDEGVEVIPQEYEKSLEKRWRP